MYAIFNSFFVIFLKINIILFDNFLILIINGQYIFENSLPIVNLKTNKPIKHPKIRYTLVCPCKKAIENTNKENEAINIYIKSIINIEDFLQQKASLIILNIS